MVAIDKSLSNKILNVSFLCTLLVVLIHCQSSGRGGVFHFVRDYIPGAFLNMAVPTFFAISGFLLAGRCGEPHWYRDAIRKRIKTLLLPYVILNVLYYPIVWGVHAIAVSRFGANDDASIMTLSWRTPFDILGIPFFEGPAITPLWYIATLMYFVLFSFVLYSAMRRSRVHAIITVASTALIFTLWDLISSVYSMPGPLCRFLYFGFSLWGLVFFTMGTATRLWMSELPSGRVRLAFGCVGVVAALVLAPFDLCKDSVFYLVPTVLCMVGLFSVVPSRPWPTYLTANSFALYALHVPFIYFFSVVLKAVHVYDLTRTGFGLLAEYGVVIVGSVVIACVLRKLFPRTVNLCFGGR